MQTINCKGTLIDLVRPRVMGIINVTPDSFYDGGVTTLEHQIIKQASQMLDQGATILDVGGYSSRPGATDISEEQEIDRVIPAIKAIIEAYPKALISIDSFRSNVVKQAVKAGACIANDISAGKLDPKMIETIGDLQIPYCMMHMRGTPQTMKSLTDYKNITKEVLFYFSERVAAARAHNINDIIIDPGFGFAKTTHQNFELLNHLELFESLDIPLLAGVSRKSMVYKTLDITPKQALNGTTALHMVALQKGARILRVHDVQPAIECIKLFEQLDKPVSN
ncbi:MAG: Dihydropteroate synthase [Flavobacteriaceae bacterium]|nr:MAG: Dihydropteroate synthase [Flavobacteriaceae bacterium]